jgi:CMP-N,N'-diacetyllegionaminic acid synthase
MTQASNLRILGIIPARKGSKRVPGKNTKMLAGKPLIEFALTACAASKRLTTLVISSDDDDIRSISENYSNVKFLQRPPELATDTSPAIDYVNHALKSLDDPWDIVVIIQPTTPFVRAEDIDATIDLLIETKAETSVSVVKLEQLHHPFKLKVMVGHRLYPFINEEGNIKAAHELPDVFSRNGAVYATTIGTIKKGLIIGDPCVGYVMPYERSVDINYPIDFEFAEFLASKYHF